MHRCWPECFDHITVNDNEEDAFAGLSGILGRMRELVRVLNADPEPERFVVLLRELSGLFNEAGGVLGSWVDETS
jgi:hypothetical protein